MVSKINNDNTFGGNYTSDRVDVSWNTTTTVYNGVFVNPVYNSSTWIEGATTEEVNQHNAIVYKKEIEDLFKYLSIRAEASSMNKSNLDPIFLKAQREEYQDKYDVASGLITSGSKYDKTLLLIQNEMSDEFSEAVLDVVLPALGVVNFTGTHLEKMFKLITTKFEYGRAAYDTFNLFVRHFRTKSFLWLETNEWVKLKQAIEFVKNIPDSLTLAEAEQLYNDFNLI